MGLLNWGAGLSAAGGAVSDFAGKVGIEDQKAQLEMQKLALADQLATAREHAGRADQFAFDQQGKDADIGRDKTKAQNTSDIQTAAVLQQARNAADLADKLNADPTHLAGMNAAAEAGITSVDRLKAQAYNAEAASTAALNNQKLTDSQRISQLLGAHLAAIDSGDKDAIASTFSKYAAATGNPSDASKGFGGMAQSLMSHADEIDKQVAMLTANGMNQTQDAKGNTVYPADVMALKADSARARQQAAKYSTASLYASSPAIAGALGAADKPPPSADFTRDPATGKLVPAGGATGPKIGAPPPAAVTAPPAAVTAPPSPTPAAVAPPVSAAAPTGPLVVPQMNR